MLPHATTSIRPSMPTIQAPLTRWTARRRLSDLLHLDDSALAMYLVTRSTGEQVIYSVDATCAPTCDCRVLVYDGTHLTDIPYTPGLDHRGIVRSVTRLYD